MLSLVPPEGFEPSISTLKGSRTRPDQCSIRTEVGEISGVEPVSPGGRRVSGDPEASVTSRNRDADRNLLKELHRPELVDHALCGHVLEDDDRSSHSEARTTCLTCLHAIALDEAARRAEVPA